MAILMKGIRILDKKNKIVSVEMPDILNEINDGTQFYWSILHLYASGNLGEGKSIPIFEEQIKNAQKGLFISWNELNSLSYKFYDLMDILIIGCKDKSLVHRYESDREMYEMCDIVIEMIDSSYWEVFSKDNALIDRLAIKFNDIKFLEPDFEK